MSRFWHARSARTATLMLVALVLLGICATGLTVCVVRLASGSWPHWVAGTLDSIKYIAWADTAVLGSAIGLAAIGLLFIIMAAVPGKHRTALLEWDSLDQHEEWVVENRGLSNLARFEAERTDGVDSASPVFDGKKMVVNVTTPVHESNTISASVQQNIQDALATVPLAQKISIRTKTSTRGGQ